jgi:23S rRNA pseudouridine2605 synthase
MAARKSPQSPSQPAPEPLTGERLQKIIASAGIASRRKAEELILAGRVQINGKIVTELGTRANPAEDHIRVDGKLLQGPERLRYFMLNKPKGYVTTSSDPQGRHTVMEFFHGRGRGGERVYPVGRLDYASEGLLLMTNDGELANQLTRASSQVEKVYLVKISGRPTEESLDQIRSGIMIDKGRPGEGRVMTAPVGLQLVRDAENPWFELTLIEGRNREIRKMFEEVGHHVEKIRRVGYGPLVLDVEPGQVRELAADEVEQLRHAAQRGKRSAPKPAARTAVKTRAAALPKARPQRRAATKSTTRRPKK